MNIGSPKELKKISHLVNNIIKDECSKIIKNICEKENLDFEHILEKYLNYDSIDDKQEIKKRNRKLPPKELQCKGRKSDFEQCTRKKKDNEDFCASHLKNLKYGSIDMENDDYIEMFEQEIDGKIYYLDNENNVYSHCYSSPTLLGTLVNDTISYKKNLIENNFENNFENNL